MKRRYTESLLFRARELLQHSANRVFLRNDFNHLEGGYRQIGRVLQQLIAGKELVKIGHGVYAKAKPSRLIDEPLIVGGFDEVAREALNRLAVNWEPGIAEQTYNAAQSTQVPIANSVRLKSRLRRQLSYAGRQLLFEGEINAR